MDEPRDNSKTSNLNDTVRSTLYNLDIVFQNEQPVLLRTPNSSLKEAVYTSKVDLNKSIMIICMLWAQMRSKDPNTKVGAAVYDNSTGSIHLGYNGFNKGVPDYVSIWNNRDLSIHPNKYDRVVHGESNSLEKALKASFNPEHSVLFITNWPCRVCTKIHIVPSGIKMMYYLDEYPPDEESKEQLIMAGIKFEKLSLSI
ncbi:hypothetical protein CCP1ISM_20002 [Azospirillaceae bacterium]